MLAEEGNFAALAQINREGDCLAAKLRPGSVHSAEGWEELLLPEIDRQQKQGKQAVKMTRLSWHRFGSNEVRLCLSVLAYNLGNLWRHVVLRLRVGKWSLTGLQQRLVKTGGAADQARPVLLVVAGGGSLDAAAVRGDAATGPRGRPGVASAGGIAGAKAAATKAGRSRLELLECGRIGRCP